jgi:hypothetical protein
MTSINLAIRCDRLLTDELYAVKSSQIIVHVSVKEFFFSNCVTPHISPVDGRGESL